MPIQTGDILLLESDTMNDTDQGGGAITGNVIVDGLSNNIFKDISTLDRVYGAVHMRKVFPAVKIQTQDEYFGSHMIISKIPKDEKIGVNLFNTENWFDRRPEAQSRVENYRGIGSKYNGFLWATQWKNSKILTIFQGLDASVPVYGEVLYLSNNDGTSQYVKITKVTEQVITRTGVNGTFLRNIVSLEISQGLEYDFIGSEISAIDPTDVDAEINNTVVANAAKYYSARPLALPGNNTDTTIKVDTVYSQVIPSSLQESAILDADAGGTTLSVIQSSGSISSIPRNAIIAIGGQIYLGNPCTVGSLSISSSNIIDRGGQLYVDGSSTSIGNIDYSAGILKFTASYYLGIITFLPAGTPSTIADTALQEVTDINRSYIWNYTISPSPEPKSLKISYMALGEWYSLYDDGDGGISGLEEGIGTGTIDKTTGTLSITLAVLPDAETAILYSWGKAASFSDQRLLVPPKSSHVFNVLEWGKKDSVIITWNDGTPKTATSDANGVITGDADGYYNWLDKTIDITPDDLPISGTSFTVNYDTASPLFITSNITINGSGDIVKVLDPNLIAGSVRIKYFTIAFSDSSHSLASEGSEELSISLIDDGVGGFIGEPNTRSEGIVVIGATVDYVTGTITFNPIVALSFYDRVYELETRERCYGNANNPTCYEYKVPVLVGTTYVVGETIVPPSEDYTFNYRVADTPTSKQEIFSTGDIRFNVLRSTQQAIVKGSIRITIGNRTYIDSDGALVYDFDELTGTSTHGGTVDHDTGALIITAWQSGVANVITANSILVQDVQKYPVSSISFRIPSAPVVSQSLQVRVIRVSDQIETTGTSDASGNVTGTDMVGSIDYDKGIVTIEFGAWVVAAGNETEDWYHVDNINPDNVLEVWKPVVVYADTMFYNATSQTFLPLDESILGLNPVRLPVDGRVPIYTDGDVVVILNNQVTSGTYVNDQLVDLGRGRIAKLEVRDSANQLILASKYTADLDVGTVTFLDVAGLSQPLSITDRIEDKALITNVQITGKLALSQPLSHDFPIANTLVSNAIIFGDKFAHTSIPFDQQTWSGVWSDTLIGNNVSAQYNNTQYPITVDNASALQERWYFIFTSSTVGNLVGENVGQILTGVGIISDIAPINPNTVQPFFTIPNGGWGSGWSAGNILRFNTYGANAPAWIIQSVGQGNATDTDFDFNVEIRGDINSD